MKGQIEAAREERSKLTHDEGLILHENDIEQLHEQRITARSAKADLPTLRAELARAEADLRRLAADLEWNADDVEQIIGRIPPRPKVNTARTLLNRRGERLSAVEGAKAATEEAASRTCELLRDARTGEPVDVSKLLAVTRAARRLGDMAARIGAATAQVDDEQAALDRLSASLKPAVADETTLSGLPAPSQDTVLNHRDRSRELNERLQSCRKHIQDIKRELDRQRKASERLAHDEQVVSTGDLVRARKHRDAGWSLIRRRHVDGAPVAEDENSAFASTEDNLPDAYEEAVRTADTLADRRFGKAEAVAQLTVMLRRIAEQEELLKSLGQEEETFGEERRGLDAAWRSMWSEAPFEPLAPDDMLEWLSIRKDAGSAKERRAKAERQVVALRRQEAESRAGVLDALAALAASTPALASQPLAVVLETADEVLTGHERAAESRRNLEKAHRQAATDEENKRKALEKAEAAWSEWRGRWADALAALGLDPTADPEAVSTQIDAIDEMRDIAEQYVRVRSAALLLQWAIDRYRLEKQAPLLKRAGQLFTTLTGGSFKNLRVDFDDQDRPHLIGERPDGARVRVPGMSTGTADQLYLALRIASVADYLDRAPPLPFIADDLFINFDDERAAAGFRVLGQVAAKTQVLFFTHHQHLADIARKTLGASIPVVSFGDASSA